MGSHRGIDWLTDHAGTAVADGDGCVVAHGRVGKDGTGCTLLLPLSAETGDTVEGPIQLAIESYRGYGTADLPAAGRVIHPINALASSRHDAH